jgi:hypothetical protein
MTTSKRAAAHELREKKITDIRTEMQALYDRLMKEPWGVDFGTEWTRLEKKYEKERGLFLLAEREFYAAVRKTKKETNM